jgi:hypothetical protein
MALPSAVQSLTHSGAFKPTHGRQSLAFGHHFRQTCFVERGSAFRPALSHSVALCLRMRGGAASGGMVACCGQRPAGRSLRTPLSEAEEGGSTGISGLPQLTDGSTQWPAKLDPRQFRQAEYEEGGFTHRPAKPDSRQLIDLWLRLQSEPGEWLYPVARKA